MKTNLLCVMIAMLCLALTVFTHVMADEIVTAPEPIAESIDTKAENPMELVYKGAGNVIGDIGEFIVDTRNVYAFGFSSKEYWSGKEKVVKEMNLIGDESIVADFAYGFLYTEANYDKVLEDGTITEDEKGLAAFHVSANGTYKKSLNLFAAEFSGSGIGVAGWVTNEFDLDGGIKAHTYVDEFLGISTKSIFGKILVGVATIAIQ